MFYYKKLVLKEKEAEKESEQSETVEFRIPQLDLQRKPSKYKRPKMPPKVKLSCCVNNKICIINWSCYIVH